MIALGGRFFQISSDGKARPVRDDMRTPFASVTDFVPEITIAVTDRLTLEDVQKRVDTVLPSANWYYAVRVTGRFEAVTTRSVPRQQPPYEPLVEVVKVQPVFHLRDVEGTLAGFRCPEFAKGVNVPGYHLPLSQPPTNGGWARPGLRTTGRQNRDRHQAGTPRLAARDRFVQPGGPDSRPYTRIAGGREIDSRSSLWREWLCWGSFAMGRAVSPTNSTCRPPSVTVNSSLVDGTGAGKRRYRKSGDLI